MLRVGNNKVCKGGINFAAAALCLFGVILITFGPAFNTLDHEMILEAHRVKKISDWHSLPYQYIAVTLNRISEFFQVKLQIAMYFSSLAIFSYRKKLEIFSLKFFLLALFSLSPYVVITILQAGKDGLAISIYAIFVSCLMIGASNSRVRLLLIALSIASLVSIREIYILLFIPFLFLDSRKFINLITYISAFIFAISIQLHLNDHKITKTYMTQYLFTSDIVGIAIREGNEIMVKTLGDINPECTKSYSLEIVKRLKERNLVNPGGIWNIDPVFLSKDGLCLTDSYDVYKEIRTLWLDTIATHPTLYIKQRIEGFSQLFYRPTNRLISMFLMILWTPALLVLWALYLKIYSKPYSLNNAVVYGGVLYAACFLFFGIGYDARYLVICNLILGFSICFYSDNNNEKKIHLEN